MAKFFKEIWVAYGKYTVQGITFTCWEISADKDTALNKLKKSASDIEVTCVIRYVQDTVKNDQTEE